MPSRVIMSSANAKTPQKARAWGAGARPATRCGASMSRLQVLRDPLHVDEQAADERGGHERQDALPERLVDGLREEQARGRAGEDGDGDRRVDGPGEARPAGALEVGEGQGDDQERLDALPQRDGESLPHRLGPFPSPGLTTAGDREEYRN